MKLFKEATVLAEAGCFAITVECVPPIIGKLMSERLPPVIIISAGAGPDCDGQSVNLYDTIGLTQGNVPKFSKKYAAVSDIVQSSIEAYCRETEQKLFPAAENCYTIDETLSARIVETIDGSAGK